MRDWRGKIVVLTGASSGIGWEMARLLGTKGARLALCARRLERLEELGRDMEKDGLAAPLVVRCDVGDWAQVEELRNRVRAELGSVDLLINNAGRGAFRPLEELGPDEAKAVVDTNLLGAIYCTQAFLSDMLERKQGHLVFVSSVLGELPAPQHAVYGATKFGMSGLAENLDYELRPRGIKVTLIEPGLVQTEFAAVSGTPLERFEQVPSKTGAEAAALIVRAVEREKRRYVTDRLSRLAIGFRRHFPRTARLVFGMAIRRMYGKPESGG